MRKMYAYENYLSNEIRIYGWEESEENEFPSWLKHEYKVYYWMFNLSRGMCVPIVNNYAVSNQLMFRLKNIRNSSHARYMNISPELHNAVNNLCSELGSLYDDLSSDSSLWKEEHVLSKTGIERWEKAVDFGMNCINVKPNPEWREQLEKSISAPYCTRHEAERIAIEFVKNAEGIDLLETNPEDGKKNYYFYNDTKNNIFKMSYGYYVRNDGPPMKKIGVIKVDMLKRQAFKENIL